ncbi:MAG: GNAT family N-acetyltransferase [Anaerolineae bacterium]|nr:GNAT family N-acetyltransferase [Phycisphaerae bacterium]
MPTVVNAVLLEGMGRALVEDVECPRVGLAKLDFTFVAGDPTGEAARSCVEHATFDLIPCDEQWKELLHAVHGPNLRTHERIAFRSSRFDREALTQVVKRLPPEFTIVRVDPSNVDAFSTLGPALVGNFDSTESYLAKGLGFGIWREGRFVSAVSSFCVAGDELEVEIQTRPEFRRGGLATISAAQLILHCLDHGLTPHWDAHNTMSADLARKLGFCDELAYETYSCATDSPRQGSAG